MKRAPAWNQDAPLARSDDASKRPESLVHKLLVSQKSESSARPSRARRDGRKLAAFHLTTHTQLAHKEGEQLKLAGGRKQIEQSPSFSSTKATDAVPVSGEVSAWQRFAASAWVAVLLKLMASQ